MQLLIQLRNHGSRRHTRPAGHLAIPARLSRIFVLGKRPLSRLRQAATTMRQPPKESYEAFFGLRK